MYGEDLRSFLATCSNMQRYI